MPDWAAKTCGNCGFVSSVEELEIINCTVCSTDKCAKCYGGTGTEMCRACAFKDSRTREFLKTRGIGL